jgi:diacylglycerol kinase
MRKITMRLLKSFEFAGNGIWSALKSGQNFRIHLVAMLMVIVLGLYLELALISWGLMIFSIGFVLAAELFNTAIERLGDEAAAGEQNQIVKQSKDISAGAVLISAITAALIGILFLLVPLVQKIASLLD